MKKSEALEILGLSEGCTADEIKQAHRQKIRENHPDRVSDPDEKAKAEEKTKLINEARDVLVNKRWEPEYGAGPSSAGYNPYGGSPYGGSPYGGSPYGGGSYGGNGSNQGDPYVYSPFDFVWTSWGGETQNQGKHAANPFDPFASSYTEAPEKTAQEELDEAQASLRGNGIFIIVKLVLFAAFAAYGNVFAGLGIYVMMTAFHIAYRAAQGCGQATAIIVLLLAVPFLIRSVSTIFLMAGSFIYIIAACALVYDISVIRSHLNLYRTAKEKVKVSNS